jgi:hypothetical protein
MSFDCRYKSKNDFCERFQGQCHPGKPGCTLYGKVVMARDVDGFDSESPTINPTEIQQEKNKH